MVLLAVLFWTFPSSTPADATLLAQATPIPSALETYGPGGVVAMVALALMWSERQRANKADDENRELNKALREMVVPALTQTRDALTQATAATTEAMKTLRKDHPP